VASTSVVAFVMTAALALRFVDAVKEVQRAHEASRRFVPADFLALLGKAEVTEVERGDAAEHELTVMFADVRGFSTRSEKHSPEENFTWLNRYLETIEPAIREHGGFVNQYYGDGIMALFPGAGQAILAARAMLRAVQEAGGRLGTDEPLKIGIGLHTGSLMLGTIGGQTRLDTGVVGDAVNTAARIEALTKTYGEPLLVSEATKDACDREVVFREVDRVAPKGKAEEVTLYTVEGLAE
jgi:class 3 adenylate cyclase